MKTVALISDSEAIDLVLPWATALAKARASSLTVVCWTHSAVPSTALEDAGPVSEHLVRTVRNYFSDSGSPGQAEVIGVSGPSGTEAAIGVADVSLTLTDPPGLLGPVPEARDIDLGQRDTDQPLTLTPNHLALRHILT